MNFSSKQTTLNNIALNKYQQSNLNYTNLKTLSDNDNPFNYNKSYKVSSKYNHNYNSDLDTIYINNLSTITNNIQNEFTDKNYYLIYCKYLEGKTLGEIIDGNYKHNYIQSSEYNRIQEIIDEYNIDDNSLNAIVQINKVLSNFNSSDNLNNFSKLSEEMLNAEIVEVCKSDSGYDAFVLKDINGNYMIINSCTNDKSLKDILTISYPICKYLTGSDDFIQVVFDYLVSNTDLTNVSQEYFSTLEYFNTNTNLYQEQVNDNLKLIEKYCDKAKNDGVKVDLYGYSLGGGIQETAYAIFKNSNSNTNKQQYIQSISVYNPFTLCAQEYQDNLINSLSNDGKLCIYSAEQDYVSTFNDSVEALLNKTVYLKADDIKANSVNGINDVGGLVIGSNSNHGFAPLDQSAFDQYGNINETGEFISINSSIHNATIGESLDSENKYKPNYQEIFNDIFNSNGVQNNLNSINSKETKTLINDLVNYFGKNFGQIKYEEITSILSDGISEIIADEVRKTVKKKVFDLDVAGDIGRRIFDEQAISDSINDILNSKNGKSLVLNILSCYLNGDITAYNRQIDRLVDVMIYLFDKNLDGVSGAINKSLFEDELKKKLKSSLKLDEPKLEDTTITTTTASTTTATTITAGTTTTTTTTTTTAPPSTTTSPTTTAPITTTTATTAGTAATTTTATMPIAFDPIVIDILGYPNTGVATTTTTTTVKKGYKKGL